MSALTRRINKLEELAQKQEKLIKDHEKSIAMLRKHSLRASSAFSAMGGIP